MIVAAPSVGDGRSGSTWASRARDAGMSLQERPKLRPLTARRIEHQGQSFVMLDDPSGVVPQPVFIPIDGYAHVVRHFNGQTTLIEIQARTLRESGQLLAMNDLG